MGKHNFESGCLVSVRQAEPQQGRYTKTQTHTDTDTDTDTHRYTHTDTDIHTHTDRHIDTLLTP